MYTRVLGDKEVLKESTVIRKREVLKIFPMERTNRKMLGLETRSGRGFRLVDARNPLPERLSAIRRILLPTCVSTSLVTNTG